MSQKLMVTNSYDFFTISHNDTAMVAVFQPTIGACYGLFFFLSFSILLFYATY